MNSASIVSFVLIVKPATKVTDWLTFDEILWKMTLSKWVWLQGWYRYKNEHIKNSFNGTSLAVKMYSIHSLLFLKQTFSPRLAICNEKVWSKTLWFNTEKNTIVLLFFVSTLYMRTKVWEIIQAILTEKLREKSCLFSDKNEDFSKHHVPMKNHQLWNLALVG